jgi:hypothetical protein
MLSRVYYLFPKADQARDAVQLLRSHKVAEKHLHCIAKEGVDISGLPKASDWQREDFGAVIERWSWSLNLLVFFGMLVVLIISLSAGNWGWTTFSALVMLATLYGGYYFAAHVPKAHIDECAQALRHGEILLMVDIPRYRIPTIEKLLKSSHPEAEIGAVGWAPESIPL